MKFKVVFSLLIFFSSCLAGFGDTSGYLSFEYIKGQKESDTHQGTFRNAQLGIIFSGEVIPEFDYAAEARYRETKVDVEQAWIRFKLSEALSFKVGLYLVPFGRYNLSNRPHQTLLINLPLNVQEMYPSSWKDLGFLIEGKAGLLFYSAYLGNGLAEAENLKSSQQLEDNNKDKAKGARIGLLISQELFVGFSYYRGKYDKESKRDITLYGADFAWESENFHVISEYLKAQVENPEPFSSGNAEGYFIQIYIDIDKLRPVVSYQNLKYDDPFHGKGFILPSYQGRGILEEQSRWALGLVYFPSPYLLFKFEYDYNKEKTLELQNNTLSVQVALSF
ncbi:MAG: porin [Candidatus Aminicenantaceae bacterium]